MLTHPTTLDIYNFGSSDGFTSGLFKNQMSIFYLCLSHFCAWVFLASVWGVGLCMWVGVTKLFNGLRDKCGLTWPKSIHWNPHSGMSGGLVGMWLDSIENCKFCMLSPACYKLVPACYLLALTFRMMLPTFQFLVPASRCVDQYF